MVNLFTILINQLGNKGQSPPNRGRNKLFRSFRKIGKTEARARWVLTSKASELIENGRCFSCKKKGYMLESGLNIDPRAVQPESIILRRASPLAIVKDRKAAPAIRREKSNPWIKSHSEEKGRFPKKDCSNYKQNG
jgi:hypothetical protein